VKNFNSILQMRKQGFGKAELKLEFSLCLHCSLWTTKITINYDFSMSTKVRPTITDILIP
jgi:hypothetical protein